MNPFYKIHFLAYTYTILLFCTWGSPVRHVKLIDMSDTTLRISVLLPLTNKASSFEGNTVIPNLCLIEQISPCCLNVFASPWITGCNKCKRSFMYYHRRISNLAVSEAAPVICNCFELCVFVSKGSDKNSTNSGTNGIILYPLMLLVLKHPIEGSYPAPDVFYLIRL